MFGKYPSSVIIVKRKTGNHLLSEEEIIPAMASLKEVGERRLVSNIMSILRKSPDVDGTEDDAAIVKTDKNTVVCSDLVTFERHMPKGMSYEKFGWTAAAVTISDLAAMGAKPVGLLVSLAMPDEMDERDLYDIVSGIDQCTEFVETTVIGGDTKPGPGVISCTALGTMENRTPMMRNGAKKGDVVAVTGGLGGPAAGFKALENGIEAEEAVFKLMTPIPMVYEGIALSGCGKVTSCMDLSDGLATAVNTICEQSHVGIEIVSEFLPADPDVKEVSEKLNIPKKDLMLYWGGEYELLFTFPKDALEILQNTGVMFSIIGHVTDDDGAYLLEGKERTRLEHGCY